MLMNKISEDNFIFIPNFIASDEAKQLANEFKAFCNDNNSQGDNQAPNSQSEYNYVGFLEMLCEKTPEVSKFLGEKVLPTYTYARVYNENSVLERHRDRAACEVSLTVHLDGDAEWPIFIQKANGEEVKLNLKSGDAMMYLGCVADHWREQFEGKEYVQVFMHYVKSRGDNGWAVFDKERIKPSDWKKPEQKIKKIEAPAIISGLPDIDEYIVELEDAIDLTLCNDILKEYKDSDEWQQTRIGQGVVDDKIRNVNSILISANQIISKNPTVRADLDQRLFKTAHNAIQEYNKRFPDSVIEEDSGYDLLRYNTGQFYVRHTDHFKRNPRTVSCSFSLNDDYEGGAWNFFDGKLIIRPYAGSIIMFPSNFMFPHEIMPVSNGTRYSVITWFI